jgi:hypothetical protein
MPKYRVSIEVILESNRPLKDDDVYFEEPVPVHITGKPRPVVVNYTTGQIEKIEEEEEKEKVSFL